MGLPQAGSYRYEVTGDNHEWRTVTIRDLGRGTVEEVTTLPEGQRQSRTLEDLKGSVVQIRVRSVAGTMALEQVYNPPRVLWPRAVRLGQTWTSESTTSHSGGRRIPIRWDATVVSVVARTVDGRPEFLVGIREITTEGTMGGWSLDATRTYVASTGLMLESKTKTSGGSQVRAVLVNPPIS